jgi:hypothetical protein
MHEPDLARLLTRSQVAKRCGWRKPASVSRYLAYSQAKIDAGETLRDTDFPLPAARLERTPLWSPTDIDRFIAARVGRGRGELLQRKQLRGVHPPDFIVGDQIVLGVRKWTVRAITEGSDTTPVRLSPTSRDAGRWREFRNSDTFTVERPIQGENKA